MEKLPQVLLNVEVERRFDPIDGSGDRWPRSSASSSTWPGEGRVVLRASGTEPVIRVMVEGRERAEVRGCADELAQAVRTAMPRKTAAV